LKQGFYEKYRQLEIESLPRYAQLREVIISAIEDRFWGQGDKLPAEVEIARTTPFSLGTVQKALKALVDDGILIRRQGAGTFIAEDRRKMDRPWHCRFESDNEGIFLPVYPKVLLRKRIHSREKWAQLLDPKEMRLIQIDRLIRVGNEFNVYCKIFLNEERFSGFLKKKITDLEQANFKTLIRAEYNLPITHMANNLRVAKLPNTICRAIAVETEMIGLIYEIIASSGRKNPVYYQELFIPPNDRRLHISDISNIPEYWTQK
jgi:GntR family transcriptional regulator